MAIDVFQKCVAANPFRNGSAVVAADEFGAIESEQDNNQINQPDEATVYNKLKNRFDDTQYYTT